MSASPAALLGQGPAAAPSPTAAPPLVDYLIARHGAPAPRGLAYDYVVAGDGVFLAAQNELLRVRVPVAPAALRGLPPVYAECSLAHGRLPLVLWERLLLVARALGAAEQEVLLAVEHEPGAGYRLCLPRQVVGPTRVAYVPRSDGAVVLEIHSHHRLAARFSPTDDADEQRLCLYGVLGRLDRARPHVALRAGAYGHFLPVPWESVFDGGPDARAAVWDSHFDGHGETAGDAEETDADEPEEVAHGNEHSEEPAAALGGER